MGARWELSAAVAAAALAGCAEEGPPRGATTSSAAAPAPAAVAPAATGSAGAEAEAEAADHLQLLRLTLTSGVKDKEPVDRLEAVPAGGRVYAHLALRNRTGEARRVVVAFLVNGKERTTVRLDVQEAWQWRTWGYNTLREGDSGELTVVVTEEDGPELREVVAPIRGGARR